MASHERMDTHDGVSKPNDGPKPGNSAEKYRQEFARYNCSTPGGMQSVIEGSSSSHAEKTEIEEADFGQLTGLPEKVNSTALSRRQSNLRKSRRASSFRPGSLLAERENNEPLSLRRSRLQREQKGNRSDEDEPLSLRRSRLQQEQKGNRSDEDNEPLSLRRLRLQQKRSFGQEYPLEGGTEESLFRPGSLLAEREDNEPLSLRRLQLQQERPFKPGSLLARQAGLDRRRILSSDPRRTNDEFIETHGTLAEQTDAINRGRSVGQKRPLEGGTGKSPFRPGSLLARQAELDRRRILSSDPRRTNDEFIETYGTLAEQTDAINQGRSVPANPEELKQGRSVPANPEKLKQRAGDGGGVGDTRLDRRGFPQDIDRWAQSESGQFPGFERKSLNTLAGDYQQLRSGIRYTLLDFKNRLPELEKVKGTHIHELTKQARAVLASTEQFETDIMVANTSHSVSASQIGDLRKSLKDLGESLKNLRESLSTWHLRLPEKLVLPPEK